MHILNESSNAQNKRIVSLNGEITKYFRLSVVRGIDSSPIGDDAVYSFFFRKNIVILLEAEYFYFCADFRLT